MTVTTSRIVALPNASTTIASRVRLWIDARSPRDQDLDGWLEQIQRIAADANAEIDLTVASRSAGREFDQRLREELRRVGEQVVGAPIPEVLCFAGHDAGVVAERLPAAMVLVRNPTGVSHSPHEDVDLADAAVAVRVVERALENVA